MTKILFYATWGLAALLKGDRENKSLRENQQVKMFAVIGYHTVICDAFIIILDACKTYGTQVCNIEK